MRFISIPNTRLEVASSGSGNNRMIFFRVSGHFEPITPLDVTRVVLIGFPERLLKKAMQEGHVSRPKLGELIPPVSGNTYERLRNYLDEHVGL